MAGTPDPYEAPNTLPYFTLWASKADMDVQRNVLLSFLNEYGGEPLENVFLSWLSRRCPELVKDERDEEPDPS